jgi:IclR family pca regulon transcriptional regulator
VNDQELAAGLRAVAAPIRGHSNRIVAAINISVPSVRVSLRELEERLASLVVDTAQQISVALGASE